MEIHTGKKAMIRELGLDKLKPVNEKQMREDRDLAQYIERVGQFCGPEYHHAFLACMNSVIIDYRDGRDAEELAKEIREYG